MKTFTYVRAENVHEAMTRVTGDGNAVYLAGGTTQLDLMKDQVLAPATMVDISRLPLRGITQAGETLRVGALTTMEELAAHPVVVERLPAVRQALLLSASTQLRNMATMGGNLLQRTRCRYFRDVGIDACNKRRPGSGCAAVTGAARMHAVLGVSERCIALHASDVAVPLVALDAVLQLQGPDGTRSVPLGEFYLPAGDSPDVENVLQHGELITSIDIPLPRPGTASGYLKVRDRISYEFALTSAAAFLAVEDGVVREARVALGGVASRPWRSREAEELLIGAPATRAAFEAAAEPMMAGAWTVPGTAFKVELAKRTLVRILETVSEVSE